MEKRRKYSEEFKREAVGLTRQAGASVSEVNFVEIAWQQDESTVIKLRRMERGGPWPQGDCLCLVCPAKTPRVWGRPRGAKV